MKPDEEVEVPPIEDVFSDVQKKQQDVPDTTTTNVELADKLGNVHINILSQRKLIICLAAMSLGLLVVFVDQSSLYVATPIMARELKGAQNSINWAATAQLLSNTSVQILYGRFADMFGRKTVLILALGILAVADLASGFAQTGVQFYIFRAFAGIGIGGVQSLTMVILSDVVTLKDRGKFQGILAAQIGIGNCVGPFAMAAFVEHSSWRNFYHLIAPIVVVVLITLYFVVDIGNKNELDKVLNKREKFKSIDYGGIAFSTTSLMFLLIALNGGGTTFAWNSAIVISMFTLGGILFIMFLIVEGKIAKLPMIPLVLFTRRSLSIVLLSNILFGMAYYSLQTYIPYYLQLVRGYSAIKNAAVVIALVLPLSITSTIGGQIISYTGHYYFVIITGYGLWTLGSGLLLLITPTINIGWVVFILIITSVGVGCTFQPTVVAAQALSKKSERAVVISCRNVIRSFGGALGIAISSLIISNDVLKSINRALKNPTTSLTKSQLEYIKENIYTKVDFSLFDPSQLKELQNIYMKAIRKYFYMTIPLMAVCFLTAFMVEDHGLHCIDELPPEEKAK